MMVQPPLHTPRLRLRRFDPASPVDQDFVIALLNDPAWIANIGQRDVSTRSQAEAYLRDGPVAMFERLGFALLCVEAAGGPPIGMCGLIRRDELPAPDLGFAFLPAWRGQGLAREAAEAVLAWARALGMARVLAIVTPGNTPSLGLLARLGFVAEGTVEQRGERLQLLAWPAPA